MELTLDGRGRDLATDVNLRPRILATANIVATIDAATRKITGLSATPEQHGAEKALVGLSSGSGFRKAVHQTLPGASSDGSALGLLFDDIPVAMVVASGFLRRRPDMATQTIRSFPPEDVCAGWANDALLAITTRTTGSPPLTEGLIAQPFTSPADMDGWHPLLPMPAWSMRRARRLDINFSTVVDGNVEIDAWFRDTRVSGDGVERGVHEYEIRVSADENGTVLGIVAIPHILPASECPAAAASAQRLVGMPLGEIRAHVAKLFLGTTTCTHLNDALRALSDVESIISDNARLQALHG